jgi:hypothetical protein
LLTLIEGDLPRGRNEWESLADKFNAGQNRDSLRDWDGLKRKFTKLKNSAKPTGDPDCPEPVRRAKIVQHAIESKSGVESCEDEVEVLDSPTRTELSPSNHHSALLTQTNQYSYPPLLQNTQDFFASFPPTTQSLFPSQPTYTPPANQGSPFTTQAQSLLVLPQFDAESYDPSRLAPPGMTWKGLDPILQPYESPGTRM